MHKILIVDDEEAVCSLIQKYLAKVGYEALTALNGEEALQRIKEETFSLMLLDIKMPGIDGIEVLRRIRHSGNNIPVIMTTAVSDESMLRETMELGAAKCLSKPINLANLNQNIKDVIEGMAPKSD